MDDRPLSPRETTVLHLIAWGYTNKEIANRLNLSVKTVEAHKANGMRKLDLPGRAALVRRAVEWGWFSSAEMPEPDGGVTPRATFAAPALPPARHS